MITLPRRKRSHHLAFLAALAAACGGRTQPQPPTPRATDSAAALEPLEDPVIEAPGDGPSNSPVSLTASDGSGLNIVAFEAKAVVEDPLAFTELHLVFHNPRPQQVEGQFSITLPPSATLSRFAMKQDWGWQEGEVVELQAARRAYEDFLHRRQDPALLEKQPGNQFHARVFPIAPSGDKEIIISYSEALTRAGEPYRVHLRGLPVLAKLDVRAVVGRHGKENAASGITRYSYETLELHKQEVQPDADFAVPLPAVSQQPQAGLRNGELLVARVTPVTQASPDPIGSGGLYVLFDTSASRALGFPAQVARLGEVLGAVAATGAKDAPLKVAAFDQSVVDIYEGTIGGFDEAARRKLLERGALGASDLTAALAHVGQKGAKSYQRLLVFTDGIVTAGAIDEAALRTAAKALSQAGIERLDALVTGGLRDAARLAALTTAGLAHDGVVIDGDKSVTTIARRLGRATVSSLAVKVPHAKWVWPTELRGMQPGDQVLIYAQMEGKDAVVVDIDGAQTHFSYPITMTEVERPLIERAVVSAEIARMQAQRVGKEPKEDQLLREKIVKLSIQFRVLCDETALLVLETEEDYARFQIDRRALSDILTVGTGGIELINRRAQVAGVPKPPPKTPQPDEFKTADNKESGKMGKKELALDAPGDADKRDDGPAGRDEGGAADPRAAAPALAGPAEKVAVARPASPSSAPAAQPMLEAEPARRMAPSRTVSANRGHGEAREDRAAPYAEESSRVSNDMINRAKVNPYEGKMKEVMDLLAAKKTDAAEDKARAWRATDAGDVLALIALGEVAEKRGQAERAARAYGSIIDLFPGRADLRRFAGERLERLGDAGLPMAIDTYKKAREQRPDHPASHRLLAFALVRAGDLDAAFTVIKEGAARSYPDGRFRGVDRILKEDVGLIAAAMIKKDPKRGDSIKKQVDEAGTTVPTERSLRFVLNWETDANDVDFHILDAKGGHAFYSAPHLMSGGDLYADVTTGYGPECFTIPGKPAAFPYTLQAHYYSRGPMGYGMGKLEIIEHDGQGGLKFEERAFVIMVDQAFVDLGKVTSSLK
jgi:tetratricopeptide (TPR) repeat protein